MEEPAVSNSVPVATLREILKNQYHAALAMLRQAIELCPDSVWPDKSYTNPFWRIAYHALYYTHLYLQPNLESFTAWEHHQTGLQYLDNIRGPTEIDDLVELPHKPPQTGEPYVKSEVLAYWSVCDDKIDEWVDALDLLDPASGFSWYNLSKLEHQIISIRHTQHHAAQLADRVRSTADAGISWVSAGREPKQFDEA